MDRCIVSKMVTAAVAALAFLCWSRSRINSFRISNNWSEVALRLGSGQTGGLSSGLVWLSLAALEEGLSTTFIADEDAVVA